jgi:hypothetical protein
MEDMTKVIVYGDFNCPYSYLASQRAEGLIRGGLARIDWRAVEHDRGLAVTGTARRLTVLNGTANWPRSRRWRWPARTCQPRRRRWSATPAPQWPRTLRRSPMG